MRRIRSFWQSEEGAVTVDWVVLTAGIVGLAAIVINQIGGATANVGNDVGEFITNTPVGYDAGGD